MFRKLFKTVALSLAALLLLAAISRAQTTTIPLGTYTGVAFENFTVNNLLVSAGEYQITFQAGGNFQVGSGGIIQLSGNYTATPERVEFTTGECAGSGVYQWRLQGNKLSLTPVATQPDSCTVRAAYLTPGTYFKDDPAASHWKPLGPAGGQITALLLHEGKAFAGGNSASVSGGVFVSADNGQNWLPTLGTKGRAVLALAAFNGNLFAGTGGGIMISTDGGQTWVLYEGANLNGYPGSIGRSVPDFVESNGRLYAATFGRGVYRMADSPYRWEKVDRAGLVQNVYTLATIGQNLFAGTDFGGVFISTDGGTNWTAVNNGLPFLRIRALAVIGNTLYAATAFGSPTTTPNEVFVSENNGQNWQRLGNGLAASLPPNATNAIFDLAVNSGKLFAASSSGVLVYEGGNWRVVQRGSSSSGFLSVTSSGNQLLAGDAFEGVTRSLDGGATWAAANSGLNLRAANAVLKASGVLYAGMDDGAFISRDEGQTWTRSNPAFVRTLNFLAFDGRVYAGTSGGVYVTADQGQTWTRVSGGLAAGNVVRLIAVNNVLYAAVAVNGVFRSADGGQNWVAVNTGLPNLQVIDLAALGPNLFISVFATNAAGFFIPSVFRSGNEGQSWTAINNGLPNPGIVLALTAAGGTLLAGTFPNGVYRSTDNGQTWTATRGYPAPFVQQLYVSGSNVYASGSSGDGVARSTDNGLSWEPVNAGFDPRTCTGFFVDGAALYAATPNGVYVSRSLVNRNATVSAASFSAGAIAEKAIVAAFGAALATNTAAASGLPLPTELAGTTVKVRDSLGVERLAPLFFVSAGQINYQIPAGTATGPATVTISNGDGIGATGTIEVQAAAPAIFTLNASGTGAAAAVDAITGAAGPFNATLANGQPNIIAVFGSGLGGDATDVDGNVNASVTARIDGAAVTLQYAGRATGLAGLNQFNVVLPAGIAAGTHTLTFARGGVTSNSVTIAIR